MSEPEDDIRADLALREGLGRLPVPETSPDFNTRIYSALRRPLPWWRVLWTSIRPALAAGGCSLLVMLALLRWSALTPVNLQAVSGSADAHTAAISKVLDRAEYSGGATGYLSALLLQPHNGVTRQTSASPTAHPRRPDPSQHARLLTSPVA